jgi:hypothetical protein
MRSWAGVSAVVFVAVCAFPQKPLPGEAKRLCRSRNNETALAGLVPGKSTFRQAVAIFGKPLSAAAWHSCKGDEIRLDLDQQKIVQTIRMSRKAGPRSDGFNDCFAAGTAERAWRTGHGLRLSDSVSRVAQLYGKPDSRSPSTKDGQRLELLYYAFDWAGPDVPQVMEVLCTLEKDGKPGQVVEITLAASSL